MRAWFAAVEPTGVIPWTLVPTSLAAVFGFDLLRRAIPTGLTALPPPPHPHPGT